MSLSASWTRMAFLAHGQNRADADNRATVAGIRAPAGIGQFPQPQAKLDMVAARHRAAASLDGMVTAMTKPGVALVAVDKRGEVAGTLTLMAKSGGINAGVIGRHGRCDLYLAGDDGLSLRHAAIVVDERGGYRLMDLRTGSGLRDAAGRRQDGIASIDEAAIGMGDHVVVCRARRHEDQDGPLRSPWAPPLALGTNVLDSSQPHPVATGTLGVAADPGKVPNLSITITGGVTRTGGGLCGQDERRQAMLELADATTREVWPVGDRALANGILFGRYERCDGHGSRILARRGISRVHAVVVAVDGAPHVLDLGSTNGTWLDGKEIKVARLSPGSAFRLGERGPSITFRAASGQ